MTLLRTREDPSFSLSFPASLPTILFFLCLLFTHEYSPSKNNICQRGENGKKHGMHLQDGGSICWRQKEMNEPGGLPQPPALDEQPESRFGKRLRSRRREPRRSKIYEPNSSPLNSPPSPPALAWSLQGHAMAPGQCQGPKPSISCCQGVSTPTGPKRRGLN